MPLVTYKNGVWEYMRCAECSHYDDGGFFWPSDCMLASALRAEDKALAAQVGTAPSDEKPLFIPLRREYFEAFRSGTKREEYRKTGGRWNARTCRPGRAAVLSLGYGKKSRVEARVAYFRRVPLCSLPQDARDTIRAIYGPVETVACIGLNVEA